MAQTDPTAKILRVGVIQSGKIVEERLLRSRQAVTIGQSTKNTFVVPLGDLPKTATLFDVKKDSYSLHFKDGMDGRLSLVQGVVDFGAL